MTADIVDLDERRPASGGADRLASCDDVRPVSGREALMKIITASGSTKPADVAADWILFELWELGFVIVPRGECD